VDDNIKVQVPVEIARPYRYAIPYIVGRNGNFDITALQIVQWAKDKPGYDGIVRLQGIGRRAKPIRGGFHNVRVKDIDALCRAWIEARGGLVIVPDDDEVTVLVTMHGGIAQETIISRDHDALEALGEAHVGDFDPDQWEYYLLAPQLVTTEGS